MTDNKCRWSLVRTDFNEFLTDPDLPVDEFLTQVKEVIDAWDDPSFFSESGPAGRGTFAMVLPSSQPSVSSQDWLHSLPPSCSATGS